FANHGVMPIASDMGDCLFTAMDIEHTALVAPGYYATMGTGIPFGLGLQASSGKRPMVLVGDGAFQMTGWELGNCKRLGLNPLVLLFNNSAWGMLKAFQKDTGYNDLDDWHFAELAETMGGKGVRVSTPTQLAEALEKAHNDETCFQLIEIMLPNDVFSRTLTRFTDAISKKSALAAEVEA
ncbi:MAG: thiamine pyrophosphate-dependent enzyme, partial [Pseudomonadota bacterium]